MALKTRVPNPLEAHSARIHIPTSPTPFSTDAPRK